MEPTPIKPILSVVAMKSTISSPFFRRAWLLLFEIVPSPEIGALRRGQRSNCSSAQHQEELGGLFQLLGGELCVVQCGAGNHGAVIGEEHGVMGASKLAHGVSQGFVARREIRNQRKATDPHYVVSGKRRQHVSRVQSIENTDSHRMGGMQMDDRSGARPVFVHCKMQKALFGRLVAADKPTSRIKSRKPSRIERAQ